MCHISFGFRRNFQFAIARDLVRGSTGSNFAAAGRVGLVEGLGGVLHLGDVCHVE